MLVCISLFSLLLQFHIEVVVIPLVHYIMTCTSWAALYHELLLSMSQGKPGCNKKKKRPTNSVIYGTLRCTLQAIRCCASYILLNWLGLGINSELLCHKHLCKIYSSK